MKKNILLIVALFIATLANGQNRICTKSNGVFTPCPEIPLLTYIHPGDTLYSVSYVGSATPYTVNLNWRLGGNSPLIVSNCTMIGTTKYSALMVFPTWNDSIISIWDGDIQITGIVFSDMVKIKFLPNAAGAISGPSTLCKGGSSNYSVQPISYATSYIWTTLNNGATDTTDLPIFTLSNLPYSLVELNSSEILTVRGYNGGNGTTSERLITVNSLPETISLIYGDELVCQGQTLTYRVPTNTNPDSYVWTLPNGVTGTSTADTITVSYGASAVSGNITVKGHSTCGNGDSTILAITVNPLPVNAGAISGSTTACQGQNSVTYNVPTIANATSYIWTLPNGATGTSTTNSISVNYGASAVSGNITVKGNNTCGNGTPSTFAITVNPLPIAAGNISGASTICLPENDVTYTVPVVTNATSYIWTLPNGATGTSTTNSISVNFGTASSGNISVKGHNDCGDGAISTLPITVTQTPATPTVSNIGNNVLSSSSASGNQWYNQNGIINGATNQNYTVLANGDYHVIVTLLGCSSDTSNILNVINSGIEVTENNTSIKVYPNPVSNELIIETKGNNGRLNFEIINAIGQVVFKGNFIEKTTVQTSDFTPGVYLIKLENGKTFEFKKIIKE